MGKFKLSLLLSVLTGTLLACRLIYERIDSSTELSIQNLNSQLTYMYRRGSFTSEKVFDAF